MYSILFIQLRKKKPIGPVFGPPVVYSFVAVKVDESSAGGRLVKMLWSDTLEMSV